MRSIVQPVCQPALSMLDSFRNRHLGIFRGRGPRRAGHGMRAVMAHEQPQSHRRRAGGCGLARAATIATMSVGAAFHQYVLEQLQRAGRVTSRRMFGAVGLYCDDVFFAIIDDDTLYFKVDDTTRDDYLSRGSKAFRPYKDRPEVSMTYYTVPVDVLDDAEELVSWARRAVAVAAAAPVKKRSRTQKTPSSAARRLGSSSRRK